MLRKGTRLGKFSQKSCMKRKKRERRKEKTLRIRLKINRRVYRTGPQIVHTRKFHEKIAGFNGREVAGGTKGSFPCRRNKKENQQINFTCRGKNWVAGKGSRLRRISRLVYPGTRPPLLSLVGRVHSLQTTCARMCVCVYVRGFFRRKKNRACKHRKRTFLHESSNAGLLPSALSFFSPPINATP